VGNAPHNENTQMKRYCILTLLIMLVLTTLRGQGEVQIHHYTYQDGLPANKVSDIKQDATGLIWLATWDGLVKFDGYKFTTFKSRPGDGDFLSSHRFTNIECTANGNLLCLGGNGSRWIFLPQESRYRSISSLFDSSIKNIFCCADNGIWVATSDNQLQRIDETSLSDNGFIKPQHIDYLPDSCSVYSVFADSQRHIWVLTNKGALRDGVAIGGSNDYREVIEQEGRIILATHNCQTACYDMKLGTLILNPQKASRNLRELMPYGGDTIVMRTSRGAIVYNVTSGTCEVVEIPTKMYNRIWTDRQHQAVWLAGRTGGLWRWSVKDGLQEVAYPKAPNTPSSRIVPDVIADRYGCIWAQPVDGALMCYNAEQNALMPTYTYENNQRHMVHQRFGISMTDRQHGLWAADQDEGVKHITLMKRGFNYFSNPIEQEARCIMEDSRGRIWVGHKRTYQEQPNDVDIYNLQGQLLGHLQSDGTLSQQSGSPRSLGCDAYCFLEDRDHNVWMGTKQSGIYIFRPQTENRFEVIHYAPDTQHADALHCEQIFDIKQDSEGRIWIATFTGGLHIVPAGYDVHHLTFLNYKNGLEQYPMANCSKIRCLCEMSNGWMLLGTQGGLVACSRHFNQPSDLHFKVTTGANGEDALNHDDVHHITQLHDGRVLISTYGGGLHLFYPPAEIDQPFKFKQLPASSPDFSSVIFATLEDNEHNIWVMSENKLAKFDSALLLQGTIPTAIRWSEGCPSLGRSNQLYFPAFGDALWLKDGSTFSDTFVPELFLTELSIHRADTTLIRSIRPGESIRLKPDERDFSISYATTDFENAATHHFVYRVVGYHNNWVEAGNRPTVNLLKMPPGQYVFEIAIDSPGVDNARGVLQVPLILEPRFSETWMAHLLWALLVLAILSTIIYFSWHTFQLRREISLEKRMSQLKLQFFTDVSHELRTPLTLIASPIEDTINREKLSPEGLRNMLAARNNADRMLRLVGQILDFSKIRADRMRIYIEKVDILPMIQQTCESFVPTARSRNIDYTIDLCIGDLEMETDLDKVEKMLYNLLGNAFKFTEDGKRIGVKVDLQDNKLVIAVRDEGRGMDLRKGKTAIFDRFETINKADPSTSTGIGLSLVREYARMLHGTIDVQSQLGKGSCFTLRLPIQANKEVPDAEVVHVEAIQEEPTAVVSSNEIREDSATRILIIEDNPDMRTFICDLLHDVYEVYQAADGEEGLEATRSLMPDVVISDVMMPRMDGIEYLKAVRSDNTLCHIPVLLLSAKATIEDQVSGLQHGANDYIPKPFSTTLLKAKVAGVLARRDTLCRYFTGITAAGPLPTKATSQPAAQTTSQPAVEALNDTPTYDRQFMERLVELINEHLSESDLRIEDLISQLNLSRSVFNRKVRAYTGTSAVDLIKRMRIQEASRLLIDEPFMTISEICYHCGFASPQYFTRVFKEVQGCAPSEYREHSASTKT